MSTAVTPHPLLKRFSSLLATLAIGVSMGGAAVGVLAVGIPTPDASPDAGRLEDKIMHLAGSIFVGGSFVSIAAMAARFLVGRISGR